MVPSKSGYTVGASLISSRDPLVLLEEPLRLLFLLEVLEELRLEGGTRLVLVDSEDLFEPFRNRGGLTLLLLDLPFDLDVDELGLL